LALLRDSTASFFSEVRVAMIASLASRSDLGIREPFSSWRVAF
jgi:hypothetical protein